MHVSDIVSRVRAAIDELTHNDSDFLNQSKDELNLTDVIIDKIGYALRHVVESAPLEKLDSNMFLTLTPTELAGSFSIDGTTKVATLVLPDELLRIIEARLSSWFQFPIPEPDTSEVALMQQDEYARGSWDRPVNILTYQNGKRVLTMYCAKVASGAGADTLNFVYIKNPTDPVIDAQHQDPDVSVPSQLEASFIYQVAGLSMVAFREDVAATLLALSEKYLKNDT